MPDDFCHTELSDALGLQPHPDARFDAAVDPSNRKTGEVLVAVGGAILLVALLVPIDWFAEQNMGGIAGRNPDADRMLTAWEAFGLWLIPCVLAATAPLCNLLARSIRRRVPWELRILLVLVGLPVVLLATLTELAYRSRVAATSPTSGRCPKSES